MRRISYESVYARIYVYANSQFEAMSYKPQLRRCCGVIMMVLVKAQTRITVHYWRRFWGVDATKSGACPKMEPTTPIWEHQRSKFELSGSNHKVLLL